MGQEGSGIHFGAPKRDSFRSPKRIENGHFEGVRAAVGNGLFDGSLGVQSGFENGGLSLCANFVWGIFCTTKNWLESTSFVWGTCKRESKLGKCGFIVFVERVFPRFLNPPFPS